MLGAVIGMDTRRHKLGLLGLRRLALGDFDRVRDFNTRDSDSEDDIPLVQLNKRKLKPIIRHNVKKTRGV